MVQFIPLFVIFGVILAYAWIYVLKPESEFTEIDFQRAPPPDIDDVHTHLFTNGEAVYKYTPASANQIADPANNSFIVMT